jgi:hypothetical protein
MNRKNARIVCHAMWDPIGMKKMQESVAGIV